MNTNIDSSEMEPVFLIDLSRSELVNHSIENLAQIVELIEFELSLIEAEATAVAGRFDDDRYPFHQVNHQEPPTLLARIRRRDAGLLIVWETGPGYKGSGRRGVFSPLPSFIFQYPRSSFSDVPRPERDEVLEVEAQFARLRMRYAQIVAWRSAIGKHKRGVEKSLVNLSGG